MGSARLRSRVKPRMAPEHSEWNRSNGERFLLGNTSSVSSMGLNRNKAQAGAYEVDWSSHCHQQEASESYETTGRQQQKLDSFTEAFCSRSATRMPGGEEQSGFNSSTPRHMPSLSLWFLAHRQHPCLLHPFLLLNDLNTSCPARS